MLKVVVLVSGGGTNLQAIIDAVSAGTITKTEIVGVISNNKNAYALERAAKAGIANRCISPKNFATRAEFNQELLNAVDAMGADLVVLGKRSPFCRCARSYGQTHCGSRRRSR